MTLRAMSIGVTVALVACQSPGGAAFNPGPTHVMNAIVRDRGAMEGSIHDLAREALESLVGISGDTMDSLATLLPTHVVIANPKQEPRCVEEEQRPPRGCVGITVLSYVESGDTARVTVAVAGVDVGGVQDVRMDHETVAYTVLFTDNSAQILDRTTLVRGHE